MNKRLYTSLCGTNACIACGKQTPYSVQTDTDNLTPMCCDCSGCEAPHHRLIMVYSVNRYPGKLYFTDWYGQSEEKARWSFILKYPAKHLVTVMVDDNIKYPELFAYKGRNIFAILGECMSCINDWYMSSLMAGCTKVCGRIEEHFGILDSESRLEVLAKYPYINPFPWDMANRYYWLQEE